MENRDILIIKYLINECTINERNALENWLQQDLQNELHFQKIKKLWEKSVINTENFHPDVQQAIKRIQEKINSEKSAKIIELKPDLFYYLKRVAAILLVGISVAVYFLTMQDNAAMAELKSGEEKKELLLSDGTKIWLNKHSTVRYPEKFEGDIRPIDLEGEAYFDVAKDPQKPFIIHSFSSVTQVVGTSFNVRAFSNEENIQVTVTSGKVAFYETSNEAGKVYLVRGDRGILLKSSGKVTKEKNDDVNFLSWQTGTLIFNDTPIEKAVSALSRHYNKRIVVEGDIAQCRITSTYDKQSLNTVLEELHMLLGAEIQNKDSTILLTGKGCQSN